MIALLALAAAAVAADPCAPVEPPARAEPVEAAAYLAVGAEEEARGSPGTAAAAYREALERAPLEKARAALARLCARAGADQEFAAGVAAMEAGDKRAAADRFRKARALGADASAALLEGICRFEAGEDEDARRLLLEAQAAPRHEAAASLFLGLLALREADPAAAAWFQRAGSDAGLGGPAASLLGLAHRSGRLVLTAFAGAAADTNPNLSPDGTPAAGGDADAAFSAAASLLFRPLGESGPYARALGTFRKQARFAEFDLGLGQAALGWQLGPEARHLRAEASLDLVALGGASYLTAGRLLADARLAFGDLSLGASYAARLESFHTSAASGYSGVHHAVEVLAEWRWAGGAAAGLGWQVERSLADDPALAWLEHGPRLWARLAPGRGVRLSAEAAFAWRTWSEYDAALGAQRADRTLDLSLLGEVDLGERFTLRASAGARRGLSNLDGFVYTQLTGGLGLAFATGLL